VQQHVRIAVSDRMAIVRQVDSTDSQRSTFGQPMRVVANADSQAYRGTISLSHDSLRTTGSGEL
jgi:hypothetical protein